MQLQKKVSESDTKGEKEMQKIIEELAGYICGKICQKPSEITDQEEMEEYCNGVCQLAYLEDILKPFEEIAQKLTQNHSKEDDQYISNTENTVNTARTLSRHRRK